MKNKGNEYEDVIAEVMNTENKGNITININSHNTENSDNNVNLDSNVNSNNNVNSGNKIKLSDTVNIDLEKIKSIILKVIGWLKNHVKATLLAVAILLIGFTGINYVEIKAKTIVIDDPLSYLNYNYSGANGEGTIDYSVKENAADNFTDDEQERINSLYQNSSITFTPSTGLSNKDKVSVKLNVDDAFLKENNIKISKSETTTEVKGLEDKAKVEEEENQQALTIANDKVKKYIEADTSSNRNYSDLKQIGERSSSCAYEAFDYAVLINGSDKSYLTVTVPDSEYSDAKLEVYENTSSPYSDPSCSLVNESESFGTVNIAEGIPRDAYDSLEVIAKDTVDKYIEKESSAKTSYSAVSKELDYTVNDSDLVFVFKGTESTSYTTYNIYYFVYTSNIYMKDNKLIDQYTDVKIEDGEGLSIEQAIGQQLTTSDVKKDTILV